MLDTLQPMSLHSDPCSRAVHANSISVNIDWKKQVYYGEPYNRRPLGRNCTAANVVSIPLIDNVSLAGPSKLGREIQDSSSGYVVVSR